MSYDEKIVDRQVGRNAQLFAQSIAELDSKEERYPYLRILISIIEQAHSEWNQAPHKTDQITQLIRRMSHMEIDADEIAAIVKQRDRERGYNNRN
jgi:hypothetical protein